MSRVPFALLLACLFAVIPSCATGSGVIQGGPRPNWADDEAEQLSGLDGKLFAVGMIPRRPGRSDEQTLRELDAAARAALLEKLSHSVDVELSHLGDRRAMNGEVEPDLAEQESVEHPSDPPSQPPRFQPGFSRATRAKEVLQAFDVPKGEVVARWYDEAAGVLYALAVLDRQSAAARYRELQTATRTVAQTYYERGEEALREGDFGSALLDFVRAKTEAERSAHAAVLGSAVGDGDEHYVPSISQYEARVSSLLNHVSVTVVDGDRQRTTDGLALVRPVVFEVTLTWEGETTPLARLPLSFELDSARLEAARTTDASGRVSVTVVDVGTFTSPERMLSARVDWAKFALLSGADVSRGIPPWLANRPPIEAQATVVKKSKDTLRVIVAVAESIENGAPVSEFQVQDAIVEALVGEGVVVLDPTALVERVGGTDVLASLSDAELRAAAKGMADVVVTGAAVSRFTSRFSDLAHWHRAQGSIRAIDLGSGEVVAQVEGEVRGSRPGMSANSAGESALRVLAERLGGRVSEALFEGLGL